MKYFSCLLLASVLLLLCCQSPDKKPAKTGVSFNEGFAENELRFEDVNGIRYYEVKRSFKNGLSFNKDGFQQEPSWAIEVHKPDSILAYSPEKDKMERFYLQYDHGRVYNFAREFFRVKTITKDSILLQRLFVQGKNIADDKDYRSEVYCLFYSKDYIEKRLHTTVEALRKPSPADSLFIRELSNKANSEPANPNLCFAARQPAVFLPNSKNVRAEKISTIDPLNKRGDYVDYLYPQYKLHINKSYKDFNLSFSVVVDAKGILHVNRVDGVMAEDVPYRRKLIEGITSVYLQNLFIIRPGTTLGYPHSSEVTLQVIGQK